MIKLCFRHKGCTKINTKIVFQVESCVQMKLSHACRQLQQLKTLNIQKSKYTDEQAKIHKYRLTSLIYWICGFAPSLRP